MPRRSGRQRLDGRLTLYSKRVILASVLTSPALIGSLRLEVSAGLAQGIFSPKRRESSCNNLVWGLVFAASSGRPSEASDLPQTSTFNDDQSQLVPDDHGDAKPLFFPPEGSRSRMLKDSSADIRLKGIESLARQGKAVTSEEAVALFEALDDEDWQVSVTAAGALADMGAAAWPGGAAEIHDSVRRGGYFLRMAALGALGCLGEDAGPEDVAVVREALQNDGWGMSWIAAQALAMMGRAAWPRGKADMIDALGHSDIGIRRAAVASMAIVDGLSFSPADADALREALMREEDEKTSWTMSELLSLMSTSAWPGGAAQMRAALQDEALPIRRSGLAALGTLGKNVGPEGIAIICSALKDSDAGIRKSAAQVLRRFQDIRGFLRSEILVALQAAMDDENDEVVGEAGQSLKAFSNETQEGQVSAHNFN